MCKKGAQCNRTLCFFAHSASELRFPDTEDELEAAAVDAAAASASAGPLPMCHPAMLGAGGGGAGVQQQHQTQQHAGLMVMPSAAGGSNSSLPLMNIGSMCSDASTATAAMGGNMDGSTSSYSMQVALQQAAVAAGSMRQGSGGSQLTGIVDDMSGSFTLGGSSDPGMLIQGLAGAQHQHTAQQQQQQQLQGGSPNCLSEPLPRLGSDPNSNTLGHTAWLQLATASQLPASQILSSIRPPGASTVSAAAAAAAQQQAQQQRQMMQQAVAVNYHAGLQHAVAQSAGGAPVGSMGSGGIAMLMSGGSGSSSHPLVPPRMDSSAEQLVASLNSLQLQNSLGADDGSRYAAHATSLLQHQGLNPATAAAAAQGVTSSRAEDFLLLQLLQDKQVAQQQQQQLARLSSSGNAAAAMGVQHTMRPAFRQASVPVTAPPSNNKLSWGFGI